MYAWVRSIKAFRIYEISEPWRKPCVQILPIKMWIKPFSAPIIYKLWQMLLSLIFFYFVSLRCSWFFLVPLVRARSAKCALHMCGCMYVSLNVSWKKTQKHWHIFQNISQFKHIIRRYWIAKRRDICSWKN